MLYKLFTLLLLYISTTAILHFQSAFGQKSANCVLVGCVFDVLKMPTNRQCCSFIPLCPCLSYTHFPCQLGSQREMTLTACDWCCVCVCVCQLLQVVCLWVLLQVSDEWHTSQASPGLCTYLLTSYISVSLLTDKLCDCLWLCWRLLFCCTSVSLSVCQSLYVFRRRFWVFCVFLPHDAKHNNNNNNGFVKQL